MIENIEKVLERGEKLDLLVDKTDNLQVHCCFLSSHSCVLCGVLHFSLIVAQAILPVSVKAHFFFHFLSPYLSRVSVHFRRPRSRSEEKPGGCGRSCGGRCVLLMLLSERVEMRCSVLVQMWDLSWLASRSELLNHRSCVTHCCSTEYQDVWNHWRGGGSSHLLHPRVFMWSNPQGVLSCVLDNVRKSCVFRTAV